MTISRADRKSPRAADHAFRHPWANRTQQNAPILHATEVRSALSLHRRRVEVWTPPPGGGRASVVPLSEIERHSCIRPAEGRLVNASLGALLHWTIIALRTKHINWLKIRDENIFKKLRFLERFSVNSEKSVKTESSNTALVEIAEHPIKIHFHHRCATMKSTFHLHEMLYPNNTKYSK